MDITDLIRKALDHPVVRSAGLGLVLFLAAWWRERKGGGYALLLLGLAWAVCHLLVNANSYLFPPRESADWLVFASLGLALVATVAWIARRGDAALTVAAAILLAAAAWLALHKLSWLIERGESRAQRYTWTAGFIAAVLLSFAAAELATRKLPAWAMAAGLALLAALGGLALRQLAMPDRLVVRLFAVGGLAFGAAAAAWLVGLLRPRAGMTLPAGMAGWMAGGTVLLFILGCLSRAAGVPLVPLASFAAALPLAALILLVAARLQSHRSWVFAAVLALAGGATVWLAARDHSAPAGPSKNAAPTGADDTGAYEGY